VPVYRINFHSVGGEEKEKKTNHINSLGNNFYLQISYGRTLIRHSAVYIYILFIFIFFSFTLTIYWPDVSEVADVRSSRFSNTLFNFLCFSTAAGRQSRVLILTNARIIFTNNFDLRPRDRE
jgi:hypothetical protein